MKKSIIIMAYSAILTSFFSAQIFTLDFGRFQLSLFRLCILVLTVLLGLYTIFNLKLVLARIFNRKALFTLFLIIWFIYAVISLIWVKDYYAAIRSLYFIYSGVVLTIALVLVMDTEVHFKHIITIVFGMIALHNLIGWYEIITRQYYFVAAEKLELLLSGSLRFPVSMFGNQNEFGMMVFVGFFIALIFSQIQTNQKLKLLGLVVAISCTILVFIGQSRGIIMGYFIGLATYVYVAKPVKYYRLGSLFFIMMAVVFGIGSGVIFQAINGFLYPNQNPVNPEELNSILKRVNLIKNGLYFLVKTWGLGTGTGNLEYWMGHYAQYPVGIITNMHNWWAEILATYGVIIFSLYMLYYIKIVSVLLRIYRLYRSHIAVSMIAIMGGFIIACVSSNTNITKEWLWTFWSIVTAYGSYHQLSVHSDSKRES